MCILGCGAITDLIFGVLYNLFYVKNSDFVSKGNQEVGVAHEVKSSENHPQFSQTTMGQNRIDPKCFQKVTTKFLKFLFNGFF